MMHVLKATVDSARKRYRKIAERAESFSQEMVVRWQVATTMPEAGMATAEYAVVLVAATGFAGLLVALLKSDAIKTLLSGIIKKALNV